MAREMYRYPAAAAAAVHTVFAGPPLTTSVSIYPFFFLFLFLFLILKKINTKLGNYNRRSVDTRHPVWPQN